MQRAHPENAAELKHAGLAGSASLSQKGSARMMKPWQLFSMSVADQLTWICLLPVVYLRQHLQVGKNLKVLMVEVLMLVTEECEVQLSSFYY